MRRLVSLARKESVTALLLRVQQRRPHSEAVIATTAALDPRDHHLVEASPAPAPPPAAAAAAAAAVPLSDVLSQIKNSIAAGFARKLAPQVLHAYAGAQQQRLDDALDIRDSVSVLWACAAVRDDRSEAVYAVYHRLKSTKQYLPADVFVKVYGMVGPVY